MITIPLDPETEQRLQKMAQAQGKDVPALARQILEDYLDWQAMAQDSEADWARASMALAPLLWTDDSWDDEGASDGPG